MRGSRREAVVPGFRRQDHLTGHREALNSPGHPPATLEVPSADGKRKWDSRSPSVPRIKEGVVFPRPEPAQMRELFGTFVKLWNIVSVRQKYCLDPMAK
ncbi:hypothetical protein Sfum_1519 [Syntrophobacter fumaroxidans MPOB]|uniref:Uncharacterized protein n=1 Tax=Syntrophobacter fumaroxidans (strain DSM 10017 / MPOB) TaxID=335543 RepID=A0LIF5_SYNFM|nr:hypothetical protein Sfum_1519 [Syntrophobacter fumaroxidans MPOB]